MTNKTVPTLQNTIGITLLIEASKCNPNGNPDGGGEPRSDSFGYGEISPGCQKNWIRQSFIMLNGSSDDILMQTPTTIADDNAKIYEKLKITPLPEKKPLDVKDQHRVREAFCEEYRDVRCFGGMLNANHSKKGKPKAEDEANRNGNFPSGKITGPVQVSIAQSIDPVLLQSRSITRKKKTNADREKGNDSEMGNQSTIDYGLFRSNIVVSKYNAEATGFTAQDAKDLLMAIMHIIPANFSATKVGLRLRGVHVWVYPEGHIHDHHVCFDTLKIDPVSIDGNNPRSFDDYKDRIHLDANLIKKAHLTHYEILQPADIDKIKIK